MQQRVQLLLAVSESFMSCGGVDGPAMGLKHAHQALALAEAEGRAAAAACLQAGRSAVRALSLTHASAIWCKRSAIWLPGNTRALPLQIVVPPRCDTASALTGVMKPEVRRRRRSSATSAQQTRATRLQHWRLHASRATLHRCEACWQCKERHALPRLHSSFIPKPALLTAEGAALV